MNPQQNFQGKSKRNPLRWGVLRGGVKVGGVATRATSGGKGPGPQRFEGYGAIDSGSKGHRLDEKRQVRRGDPRRPSDILCDFLKGRRRLVGRRAPIK